MKTLEYLAAGRPVVSTDLPGARWLLEDLAQARLGQVTGEGPAEIMTLASTPAEFVSAVRRMVPGPRGEQEQARREQCRAFAARHSWARRARRDGRGHRADAGRGGAAGPGNTYGNRARRPDSRMNYLARRISARFLSKFGPAITWVGRPGAAGGTASAGHGGCTREGARLPAHDGDRRFAAERGRDRGGRAAARARRHRGQPARAAGRDRAPARAAARDPRSPGHAHAFPARSGPPDRAGQGAEISTWCTDTNGRPAWKGSWAPG